VVMNEEVILSPFSVCLGSLKDAFDLTDFEMFHLMCVSFVVGLLLCFFGNRLFGWLIFLGAFFAGFVFVTKENLSEELSMCLLIAFMCGFSALFLYSYVQQFISLFLAGGLGFLISRFVIKLMYSFSNYFPFDPQKNDSRVALMLPTNLVFHEYHGLNLYEYKKERLFEFLPMEFRFQTVPTRDYVVVIGAFVSIFVVFVASHLMNPSRRDEYQRKDTVFVLAKSTLAFFLGFLFWDILCSSQHSATSPLASNIRMPFTFEWTQNRLWEVLETNFIVASVLSGFLMSNYIHSVFAAWFSAIVGAYLLSISSFYLLNLKLQYLYIMLSWIFLCLWGVRAQYYGVLGSITGRPENTQYRHYKTVDTY